MTIAKHLGAALVGDELGAVAGELMDGGGVQVVEVFMRHEDVVRLGHGGIVDGLFAQFRHRVDHDHLVVIVNSEGRVDQGVELDGLAALGGEGVGFVGALLAAGGG